MKRFFIFGIKLPGSLGFLDAILAFGLLMVVILGCNKPLSLRQKAFLTVKQITVISPTQTNSNSSNQLNAEDMMEVTFDVEFEKPEQIEGEFPQKATAPRKLLKEKGIVTGGRYQIEISYDPRNKTVTDNFSIFRWEKIK